MLSLIHISEKQSVSILVVFDVLPDFVLGEPKGAESVNTAVEKSFEELQG